VATSSSNSARQVSKASVRGRSSRSN
jgi:hypothetical protein